MTSADRHPSLDAAYEAWSDAFEQWLELVEAYHYPDKFRRRFETVLQSLRNITFRLQTAKDSFNRWDQWYLPWQAHLKADPIMKWLNEARIDVVHKRGLNPESYALIYYVDSYAEPKEVLLRVKAKIATDEIVALASKRVPEKYRQHVALEVTRHWIPPGLDSTYEATEVCAYALLVLGALLEDADAVTRGVIGRSPSYSISQYDPDPRLLFDPSLVPILFEADTGKAFSVNLRQVERTDGPPDEVHQLFDSSTKTSEMFAAAFQSEDLIEAAHAHHAIARQIFRKAGQFIPTVFVRSSESTRWTTMMWMPRDKRDKFCFFHTLAGKILAERCDALISIGESWLGLEPDDPYGSLDHQTSFAEALTTDLLTASGEHLQLTSKIVRVESLATTKPPTTERSLARVGYLHPVCRAWEIQPSERPRLHVAPST